MVARLTGALLRHLNTLAVVDAGLTELARLPRRLGRRQAGDGVWDAGVIGGRSVGCRVLRREIVSRDDAVRDAGVAGRLGGHLLTFLYTVLRGVVSVLLLCS